MHSESEVSGRYAKREVQTHFSFTSWNWCQTLGVDKSNLFTPRKLFSYLDAKSVT